MANENLKQKTKIGMLWNFLEKISLQGVSFIINIILARLLTPHDYGVVGMFSVFLLYANVFIESGFVRGLIQKKDITDLDYSTTFYFNLVISIVIYIILYFLSPTIARFYDIPEYITLQRVLFLILVINSLTLVQGARLQRSLNFKTIAIINFLSTLVSGILGIVFAYKGFGVWALIIQTLTKSVISAILFWIFGKWKPLLKVSLTSFKTLFSYSSKLLIASIVGNTVDNLCSLFVGKLFKPVNMGYYTRARQFPELISGTISSILNSVTFPLLSSIQEDKEDLINIFKRLIKVSSLVSTPTMIGFAILSKPIIIVILGDQWLPVAELMFWISISYIVRPINVLDMNILNAIGRSDIFLKVYLAKIPVQIITMLITFPIGLRAIVIGEACSSIIYFIMSAFMIGKLFNFGPIKQFFAFWNYLFAGCIMGICVFLITQLIDSYLLQLIIGVPVGVVTYMLLLEILKDDEYIVLRKKLVSKILEKVHK